MLNISYALCGAHTVCCDAGPSLVSFFLQNHSLVLSRRLKQSRFAALLHLALSTTQSTVTAVLLRYIYAVWCPLVLRIKSLNAAESMLSSRSSSCCISILFLIWYSFSSMLCSMLTILTHLSYSMARQSAQLKKEAYYAGTPGMVGGSGVTLHVYYNRRKDIKVKVANNARLVDGLVSSWSLIPFARSNLISMAVQRVSLLRQLLLQLCPSLLLSRTQFRLPLCPGGKSLQLTGADGSTHSATGFVVYDVVCWFAYHWFLAVGHGYQIRLVEVLTVIDFYGQLNTFDYLWHYVGVAAVIVLICWPLSQYLSLLPLYRVLCAHLLLSHGIVVGCTAHLGRLLLCLCLCSKYVPTEVRPVTVGPLKGALCLSTLYPTALLLVVPHTWTLPRLLAVLHTWVVFCSVSVSAFAPSMSQQRFVLLLLGR
ncbi:hypothetical protein MIR68_005058 [Amoeboaphelidium protococcarum]|nr:hypothetical protein MIR68_005058 [Amoeboaphelidium protococcarum]